MSRKLLWLLALSAGGWLYGQCPPAAPVPAPIFENFSNESPGISGSAAGTNLSNCWTLFSAPSSAFNDWETEDANGNNENSLNTGPHYDATTFGSSGGMYIFLETSSGSAGDTAYFASPSIDLAALTSPELKFAYHMYGAAMGDLTVQVNDGTGWATAWSVSGEQQTSGSDPWLVATVDLSSYASPLSIRFGGVRGTSFTSDMSLDDISIDNPPLCPNPSSQGAFNISAGSADLYWSAGDAAAVSWEVEWGVQGFGQGSGTVVTPVANDTVSVSGLAPVTTYDFYVREACVSGGFSNWVGPFPFTTPCAPFVAPYTQDFTNTPIGFATDFGNCWTQTTGTANPRWEAEDASGGNENSFDTGPHYDNTSFGQSGGIYMYMETSGGGGNTRELTTAEFDVSALNQPYVEFYYHMYGAAMGTLAVDVWEAGLGWQNDILTITGQQQTAGSDPWVKIGAPLPAGYDSIVQIRFRGTSGTTFTSDMAIDDFSMMEAPLCPSPVGINVTNIGSSSALVNFNALGSSFNVEWGPTGFAQGTGTLVTDSTTSISISGLSALTSYDVYVQADCDTNGNSTWEGPITFSTAACDTSQLCTYTVDLFDTFGDGWNGNVFGFRQGGIIVGTFGAGFTTGTVFGPESVDLCDNIATDIVVVTMGGFPTEVSFTVTNAFGIQIFSFGPGVAYNASTVFHSFTTQCTPPACADPFNLSAFNITANSADITWDTFGSFTGFNVEWGPAGYAQGTGTTFSSSNDTATITGLQPLTDYDYYVQMDCDTSGNSGWAGPFTFTTGCAAFAAPYTEDFENLAVGFFADFGNCWTQPNSTANPRWETEDASGANENSFNTGPHFDNTQFGVAGGIYMYLETSGGAGNTRELTTADVDVSTLTVPFVEFYYHMYGQTMGTLALDVWTAAQGWTNDIVTFTGQQQASGADMWLKAGAVLPTGYDSIVRFRFRGTSGTSFNSDMSIDDFSVLEAPACPDVTSILGGLITGFDAEILWNGQGGSNFNVEWGPAGFGQGSGTVIPTTTDSVVITGLSPVTSYDVYIQNDCSGSGNGLSNWIGPFNFTTTVTCPNPTNITVNPGATNATFNWTAAGAPDQNYVFGPAGTTPTTGTIMNTTNNTASVTGLTDNTPYTFWVRDSCGVGDVSIWEGPFDFTTLCLPITAPYIEPFTSVPAGQSGVSGTVRLNNCWEIGGTGGGPRWESEDASGANENSLNTGPWYDATSFGQAGGIYMYLETSTGASALAAQMNSPLVDISALSSPNLSFAYHMYGATMDSLRVDIFDQSTGNWTTGAWSAFGQQQTAGNDPWVTANVDLSSYGDTVLVRFNGKRGASFTGDMSIDDVRFDEAPSCLNPSFPGIITVNTTDATIYWTAGDPTATGWVVEYGATGFALGTGSQANATNDTTTLTGLTPSTNYEFYVAELCPNGIDTSNFVGPISFQTLCVAASIPYLRDFDGANWPPLCWTIGGPNAQMISQGNNDYLEASFWSFNNATATSTTEPITISTDARVKFRWAHQYNNFYPLDQMIVLMRLANSTQWDTIADFVGPTFDSPNASPTVAPPDGDFIQEIYNIDTSYTGQDVVFEFVFNSDFGPDVWVDDFIVEPLPACPEPTTLTAANVGAFSVDLSWANGNAAATTWYIEYGPTGFPLGSGTVVTTTTNPYTLTGLSPATTYTAYVLELCANGIDTSAYSTPVTFNTLCAPVTAPYIQTFTGTAAGIVGANPPTDLPNCWSLGAAGPNWQTEDASGANENSLGTGPFFDNTTPTTPGGMYLYLETSTGASTGPAYVTSPLIVTSSLTTPNLSFFYHMYGATMDSLRVDIYDQATQTWNVGVWSLFGQQQTAGSDPWLDANVPLSAYGDTIQIRFMGKRGSSFTGDMSLDDISVDEAPACPNPFSLTAGTVTASTANLSWTAGSPGANSFVIEYGAGITQPGTGTIVTSNTDSITLTGLNAATTYCYFVREICPNGIDTSNAVGPFCFSTACATVSLPYNTGFTGTTPGTIGAIPLTPLPNCWEIGVGSGARWETEDASGANENSLNTGPFYDATTPGTAGGMYIYLETSFGTVGDTAAAVMVPVDLGAGNADLEFYYHMFGAAMGNLYVQINDGSGWTTLDTLAGQQQTAGSDSFLLRVIPLTGYTGVVSIKFLGERGTSFTSDMSIDEISVVTNGNPNCPTPSALADSAYCTSADISWVSGSGSSFIEYGPVGFMPGSGTIMANATSPVTISNLMLNTTYDYYVYDLCNGGADTSFGGLGTFTTPSGPVAAFTYQVNQGTVSFDASGSSGSNTWSWDFGDGTNGSGSMTTHTYLSNGSYSVSLIVSDTSCGITDTLTQIVMITNVATCPQPSGLSTGSVECDSVVVNFTSVSGASLIEYGPSGFTPGTGTVMSATSPAVISGLNPGTTYDYYVADVCAATSDTSGFAGPVAFSTPTAPVPTVSAFISAVNISLNDATVEFDASNSTNAATYTWDFGNATGGNGPTPTATYQQNGTYFVLLTVANGCGSADTIIEVSVQGISVDENELASSLNIFPNPTQDIVNVVIENPSANDYAIELIDALGQVIEVRELDNARGRSEVKFDLSSRAQGIYLLRVRTGNAAVTRRVTRN